MGVIKIFKRFFKKRKVYQNKNSQNNSRDKNINISLKKIHDELEDHLTAINENTVEIQSNFQYTSEINEKIEKLSERLEKIELFLQSSYNYNISNENIYDIKPLTRSEQEIFMILYTMEDENGLMSIHDISKKAKLSQILITDYISSMIEKGIPILKKYFNNKAFLKLDPQFKTLQIKQNILKIDNAQKMLANYN